MARRGAVNVGFLPFPSIPGDSCRLQSWNPPMLTSRRMVCSLPGPTNHLVWDTHVLLPVGIHGTVVALFSMAFLTVNQPSPMPHELLINVPSRPPSLALLSSRPHGPSLQKPTTAMAWNSLSLLQSHGQCPKAWDRAPQSHLYRGKIPGGP